jgi:DNA repair ATPase RecN
MNLSGGTVVAQNRSERQQINSPLLAEMLRLSSDPRQDKDEDKEESKMPLFWRVFGSTVLSIAAMVVVTAYQAFASNLAEVRNDIGQLNKEMRKDLDRLGEAQAELVKVEECDSRMQSVWQSLKELKEDRNELSSLRERCNALVERCKASEDDRRKLGVQMQELREQRIQAAERRTLAEELAALRERLAGLEGGAKNGKLSVEAVRDE